MKIVRRDPNRIPRVLGKLGRIWESAPDLRLGQLLFIIEEAFRTDPFYLEDDKLEAEIDKEMKKRKLI